MITHVDHNPCLIYFLPPIKIPSIELSSHLKGGFLLVNSGYVPNTDHTKANTRAIQLYVLVYTLQQLIW